jgi:hypothetical protein
MLLPFPPGNLKITLRLPQIHGGRNRLAPAVWPGLVGGAWPDSTTVARSWKARCTGALAAASSRIKRITVSACWLARHTFDLGPKKGWRSAKPAALSITAARKGPR